MSGPIAVACDPHEGGWRCTVTIGTDADATTHTVAFDRETLDDLAAGATPARLVRTAFEFLLEREPRESILRSFELPIISQFFAEFADEMRRRLREP